MPSQTPLSSIFKAKIIKKSINKMTSTKMFRPSVLLIVLAMSFAGAVPSRAQEQSSAPQKQREARPKPRGPAQQLAHETNEAAGQAQEKDETEEFKKSPSVQLIARLTGLNPGQAFLLSSLVNFAVIAAALVWAGRKYLPPIFRARTAAIQKAMQEAQKASEEARRRLADIESRLMKLDGEIGMMRDSVEKEAAAEEARIRAAAEQDARKVFEAAQREIAAAIKAARRELTAYAADLAVALAKKQIHVDPATDQALVRNFAAELGNESPAQVSRKESR